MVAALWLRNNIMEQQQGFLLFKFSYKSRLSAIQIVLKGWKERRVSLC